METNTFELHVFVAPIRPSSETIDQFKNVCAAAPAPMKALLLELDFQGQGFLGVLQSSRYLHGGELNDAIREIHEDAKRLSDAGLEVVREKIEAVANTSPCVPLRADDPRAKNQEQYFELHLLFSPVGGEVTAAHEAALQACSQSLSQTLSRPVPRSFNAFKTHQRFLNLRAYGVGLEEARADVQFVVQTVLETKCWELVKVIEEYVCFDTNKALDRGWLEPL